MKEFLTSLPLALGLCLVGFIGGTVAHYLHTPLPYMLGSLILVALISGFFPRALPAGYRFPEAFRSFFIAIIGATIGAKVTWDVVLHLPRITLSLAALTLFVPATLAMNYAIFRKLGRYDRPTAFFAASPGGLIESIIAGEAAGADVRILTVQQFLRIITVITLLPIALSLWYGHPVGSAGGVSLNATPVGFEHLHEVLVVVILGLALLRLVTLPAGQLIGPLVCAAIATLSGLAVIEAPQWLVNGCQIVIGTSLGTRFAGMDLRRVIMAGWLSVISVTAMLVLGFLLAVAVHPVTGQALNELLISFSPGGVTEMALIALSLNANPAVVTIHHLYRIILTVSLLGVVQKRGWFRPRPAPAD